MVVTMSNASPPTAPEAARLTLERRSFARVKLALAGRYMTPDGGEYPCLTTDISPGGVRLKGPRVCPPGAQIIAYIQDLGRIEGVIVRSLKDGFALAIGCTPRKTQRLLNRIEWLLHRNSGAREQRAEPRFEPEGAFVTLYAEDGSERVVELSDISSTGFAFRSEQPINIGERLELGTQRACVTRTFPGGAVAMFD